MSSTSPFQRYAAHLAENMRGGGLSAASAAIWDALLTFQDDRDVGGNIAEIGVFKGFGAAMLAMHLRRGERLSLVDIHDRKDEALRNIDRISGGCGGEIVFHWEDSRRLRKRHALLGQYDTHRFVHVDGEHSYEAVMNDLDLAVDLCHRGGVIVVDDVFAPEVAQVTQALFHYLDRHPDAVRMFLCGYNKAYLCSPHNYQSYREFCRIALPDLLAGRGAPSRLCLAGWSPGCDYLTLVPMDSEYRYQVINKMLDQPF